MAIAFLYLCELLQPDKTTYHSRSKYSQSIDFKTLKPK